MKLNQSGLAKFEFYGNEVDENFWRITLCVLWILKLIILLFAHILKLGDSYKMKLQLSSINIGI